MGLTDSQRMDAAQRMIAVVCGEPYGDGMTVTDIGAGYAPGASGNEKTDLWVLGNWNEKTKYDRTTGKRIVVSDLPKRLGDALERLGINVEWCDEWARCDDCQKLIRIEPDCYFWTPQYVETDEGYLCHDCAVEGLPDTLELYVNNEKDSVTWLTQTELESHGWTDAFPGAADAASGMHPGQNDSPAAMLEKFRATGDTRDYLFVITDKGQFDVHYRMLAKPAPDNNDEDNDE